MLQSPMPRTNPFRCSLRYEDSTGKFQGPLNKTLLKLVSKSLKKRVAEGVIIEGQKKALPHLATSSIILAQLRMLNQDKEVRKEIGRRLNLKLQSAITHKFATKGFSTWKGLSKFTRERKTKYKYHPLLNTLALKREIRENWVLKGFNFPKIPDEKVSIEQIKKEDVQPLGFRISFPVGRPGNLRYPRKKLSQVTSFQKLIAVHTKGSKKTALPPRHVLLTSDEFLKHVWKPSMSMISSLCKGKFRRRAEKVMTFNVSSKTLEHLVGVLKEFRIKGASKIAKAIGAKPELQRLNLASNDIREILKQEGMREAINSQSFKEKVKLVEGFFETPGLPDAKRAGTTGSEEEMDRLQFGEENKEHGE